MKSNEKKKRKISLQNMEHNERLDVYLNDYYLKSCNEATKQLYTNSYSHT